MERSGLARLAIAAAAVVTVAASGFAVVAAVTSSDDVPGVDEASAGATTLAGPTSVAAPTTSAGATTTSPAATSRIDVDISGFQFGPAELVVRPGTLVVWTNRDSEPHSVISDGRLFANSPTLETDDTYELVFDEPGTYPYLCGFHPNMTATITVEA